MPDYRSIEAAKTELSRALTRAEIADAKLVAAEKEIAKLRDQLQMERLHHNDELDIAEEDRRRSMEQAEQREHFLLGKIEELEKASQIQQAVINGYKAQQSPHFQPVPVVAVPMIPIFGSIPVVSIPNIPAGLYQWIPSTSGFAANPDFAAHHK